jgi:hypothetical protein
MRRATRVKDLHRPNFELSHVPVERTAWNLPTYTAERSLERRRMYS